MEIYVKISFISIFSPYFLMFKHDFLYALIYSYRCSKHSQLWRHKSCHI